MPSIKSATKSVRGTVLQGKTTRKRHNPRTPAPMPRKGHIQGTDHWDAKKVLAYKISPGDNPMYYFLVEWDGWDLKDCTWEPAGNLNSSWHLVKQFMASIGKKILIDPETQNVQVEDLPN